MMTSTCLFPGVSQEIGFNAPALPPFISVIVPVRNEAGFIHRTLKQLLDQNYDRERFEVIVADGQSTDGTKEIVRALQANHANLRLLDNPKRWSSAGRNLGIRSARGDFVVIIDGHCHLDDSGYLAKLADAFERSGADCVGRPQPLDVSGATTLQRAIALARSSRLGHHPDSFIYHSQEQFVPPQSVAVAYRSWVFEIAGLFDETFDACEDVEFNHRVDRAGLRCFFTPEIGLRYVPRSSLTGLFGQMVRYGRGRIRLLQKHPATFSFPGLVPGPFLVGLLAGLVLAWFFPWIAVTYAVVLGLYALGVLAFSLAITLRERDGGLFVWLVVVFPTVHLGAGAGILQEWISGWWRRKTGTR